MKFSIRGVAIVLASYLISSSLVAMSPEEFGGQPLPPAPPGPYQLDPSRMSAKIYNQRIQEAPPYPQNIEGDGGYDESGYYRGSNQPQYPQYYSIPEAYYPPQGGYYGYSPRPGYQDYQRGYLPGYYPGQGNYGYPYR